MVGLFALNLQILQSLGAILMVHPNRMCLFVVMGLLFNYLKTTPSMLNWGWEGGQIIGLRSIHVMLLLPLLFRMELLTFSALMTHCLLSTRLT